MIQTKELWQAYKRVRNTPSDINQHCRVLRLLAKQCNHATEFGVRYGVSTIALLSGCLGGKLQRLISYDIAALGPELKFKSLAPGVFEFIRGNSLEVVIEETDLLFIDTWHTGWQILHELQRHHQRVKRRVVMHDTVLYGTRGERGRLGLWAGIGVFLSRYPQWRVATHYDNNCGLTVLERGR